MCSYFRLCVHTLAWIPCSHSLCVVFVWPLPGVQNLLSGQEKGDVEGDNLTLKLCSCGYFQCYQLILLEPPSSGLGSRPATLTVWTKSGWTKMIYYYSWEICLMEVALVWPTASSLLSNNFVSLQDWPLCIRNGVAKKIPVLCGWGCSRLD